MTGHILTILKMVEYSTVFEDGHVYNQKLDEFTWLTKEEKQKSERNVIVVGESCPKSC